MCYDLSFSTSIELVTKYLPQLKLEQAKQMDLYFTPTDHRIAQSYQAWPIVINEDGELKLKAFEWGLIAGYMNTPERIKKERNWMANARCEKVLDSKAYWSKIRQQRCIIPATGFYEHREIQGMKTKVPYFIHRNDQPAIFLAGLYNYAPIPHPETGEAVGTFTIITRPANPLMAKIHNSGDHSNRMPLQLENDIAVEWLKPGLTDQEIQGIIDFQFPEQKMEAWPVFSVRGRSIRPDGEPKYVPYAYAGLPGIDDEPAMNKQGGLF